MHLKDIMMYSGCYVAMRQVHSYVWSPRSDKSENQHVVRFFGDLGTVVTVLKVDTYERGAITVKN